MGDHAGLHQRCELFGRRPAGAINITAQTVDSVIRKRDGFVVSPIRDHGQNGSKHFFLPDAHCWFYTDDQRGFVISAVEARRFPSADHNSGTLRARIFDLSFYKVELTLSYERAFM